MLYRTNAQSRVVEEAMMRLGVPYKVVGGTRFYDRREVKDAMAYLRAVVNPADEVSVKRVLNVPKRGVGDASIAKLDAFAAADGHRLPRAPCAGPTRPASPVRRSRGIDSFVALLDELGAMAARPTATATRSDAARATCCRPRSNGPATSPSWRPRTPSSRPGGWRTSASSSARPASSPRLDEFLEQVSLVADTDDITDDDQVVLMTLHSAKGLEFPVVFLVGVEEGVFPHTRALTEPDELEEERRLAYVGITRARERLLRHPRLEPQPVRLDAVQPAVAVPRRDPRRARRVAGQRHRPQRVRAPEPAAALGLGRTAAVPPPARAATTPTTSERARRPPGAGRRGRPAPPAGAARRSRATPTTSACASATTSSTRRSARA